MAGGSPVRILDFLARSHVIAQHLHRGAELQGPGLTLGLPVQGQDQVGPQTSGQRSGAVGRDLQLELSPHDIDRVGTGQIPAQSDGPRRADHECLERGARLRDVPQQRFSHRTPTDVADAHEQETADRAHRVTAGKPVDAALAAPCAGTRL